MRCSSRQTADAESSQRQLYVDPSNAEHDMKPSLSSPAIISRINWPYTKDRTSGQIRSACTASVVSAVSSLLADRTNGRAYATVFCP